MKKTTSSPSTLEDIHKLLKEVGHNQKISNQKIDNFGRDVEFKIMAEAASTRRTIEQTFRAEIQVSNNELRNELKKAFKNDLDERLGYYTKALRQELQHTFGQIVAHFDEKLTKFKNQILTTVDPLLKELETRRQDREIATDQSMNVSSQLKSHEKRIIKLEHVNPTL